MMNSVGLKTFAFVSSSLKSFAGRIFSWSYSFYMPLFFAASAVPVDKSKSMQIPRLSKGYELQLRFSKNLGKQNLVKKTFNSIRGVSTSNWILKLFNCGKSPTFLEKQVEMRWLGQNSWFPDQIESKK